MRLYHGSRTAGIRVLEPRQADHERPYIYLTTSPLVAALYLTNTVESPYYWFPYGFDKTGRVLYHELYPDAFREAAAGKAGYIYTVNTDIVPETAIRPFPQNPFARLGAIPMAVDGCLPIRDAYSWLLAQEAAGNFFLCRFAS